MSCLGCKEKGRKYYGFPGNICTHCAKCAKIYNNEHNIKLVLTPSKYCINHPTEASAHNINKKYYCNTCFNTLEKSEVKKILQPKKSSEKIVFIENNIDKCIYFHCKNIANYNYKSDKNALFCDIHKDSCIAKMPSRLCITDDCFLHSSYGYNDTNITLFCKQHNYLNLPNLTAKPCYVTDCTTSSTFGYEDIGIAISCYAHKTGPMVDIYREKCIINDCKGFTTYGFKSDSIPIYCKQHFENYMSNKKESEEIMINLVRRRCLHCDNTPSYGTILDRTPILCAKCARDKDGYIDIVHDRCHNEYCFVSANYGYLSDKKRVSCAKHRLDNMYDLINKLCETDKCYKYALYGYEVKKPTHCINHKVTNMENVKSKQCNEPGCTTQPTYNYLGIRTPLFCAKHGKMRGMVAVDYIKCKNSNCINRGYWFDELLTGEKRKLFCGDHKTATMKSANKECAEADCKKSPSFGYEDDLATYCKSHKLDGMINVKHNKMCSFGDGHKAKSRCLFKFAEKVREEKYCHEHSIIMNHDILTDKEDLDYTIDILRNSDRKPCRAEDCKNKSVFARNTNYYPEFCGFHEQKGYINVNSLNCNECSEKARYLNIKKKHYCQNHLPAEYNTTKKCKYCDIDNTITNICSQCKNTRNKKEVAVANYLSKNINISPQRDNSTMLNGMEKYRPDIYYDLGTYSIIVEVDEFQHKSYNEICECVRMINITGAVGKPIIFIRFNSDNTKFNGKIVAEIPNEEKYQILTNTINYYISSPPPKNIKLYLVQLYYDCEGNDYEYKQEADLTNLLV